MTLSSLKKIAEWTLKWNSSSYFGDLIKTRNQQLLFPLCKFGEPTFKNVFNL